MSFDTLEFSEHYTSEQQEMVIKILAEQENRGLKITEGGLSFSTNAATAILSGRATYDFTQQLNTLWKELFSNEAVKEIASNNKVFSASYSDDDKALCSRINLRLHSPELKSQNISNSSIAVSMSKSPGAISQLLNGKYKASPTKHLHDIWALVEPIALERTAVELAEKNKPISLRYGDIRFVDTSIARLMNLACDQARERRRFSIFAGNAGLGKTMALKEYCRVNDYAILIKGSEQTASNQIIEQLCKALGLPKSVSASTNIDKIVYALQDSDRLIILDEADKCKPNALDPLRTISDNARVGVTLVGNNQLVDKIKSQERFELIASRVCFWPKPMGQVTVEDIKYLFSNLTKDTLLMNDTSDKWWVWLHKRVEGNARELVENLLPHLLKFSKSKSDKKIDRLLVNSIFSTVLNKPAV